MGYSTRDDESYAARLEAEKARLEARPPEGYVPEEEWPPFRDQLSLVCHRLVKGVSVLPTPEKHPPYPHIEVFTDDDQDTFISVTFRVPGQKPAAEWGPWDNTWVDPNPKPKDTREDLLVQMQHLCFQYSASILKAPMD